MKVQYFEDTDTLHIVFRPDIPAETRDLDDNTFIDIDGEGRVCSLTIEQARERVGDPRVDFESIHS
jgi:uncharacterized protein YuzE